MLFSELNLNKDILRAVEELGYTETTEIQAKTIAPILEGRDVTGKILNGYGQNGGVFASDYRKMYRQPRQSVGAYTFPNPRARGSNGRRGKEIF